MRIDKIVNIPKNNLMSCFYTIKYKQGQIHCKSINNVEFYKVAVDQWAYPIEVKSIRSAKIMITKHSKKYGG